MSEKEPTKEEALAAWRALNPNAKRRPGLGEAFEAWRELHPLPMITVPKHLLEETLECLKANPRRVNEAIAYLELLLYERQKLES